MLGCNHKEGKSPSPKIQEDPMDTAKRIAFLTRQMWAAQTLCDRPEVARIKREIARLSR